MITLLLQEAQQSTTCLTNGTSNADPEPTGSLLSFLLMEGCLDKLLSWSMRTGEFVNILKLEQLKFYEVSGNFICSIQINLSRCNCDRINFIYNKRKFHPASVCVLSVCLFSMASEIYRM